MASPRVWLITGASSGFGLELCKIAASRGDRVIAATRSPGKIPSIPGVTAAYLDPNDELPRIEAAMQDIVAIHGTVDTVVNNAGYVQTGLVEETSPADTLAQFRVNVFGPLNIYRAVLPHLRRKRAGTLVTVGSMAAWYAMRSCNLYNASKAALRWLALGLADEVRHLGIRHCLVEPGVFRTNLLKPGANMATTTTGRDDGGAGAGGNPDYAEINAAADSVFAGMHGQQIGDPVKGCEIIYEVVTSSGRAAGRDLPEFLPLGSDAVVVITEAAQKAIDEVKEWEDIAVQCDHVTAEK
ncbi:NAD(P)-binding protein [Xylariomycetidae sp. FL2044]|nr:NAD(P)-binding protein [Xylariomycetidae sp. FL2044]